MAHLLKHIKLNKNILNHKLVSSSIKHLVVDNKPILSQNIVTETKSNDVINKLNYIKDYAKICRLGNKKIENMHFEIEAVYLRILYINENIKAIA